MRNEREMIREVLLVNHQKERGCIVFLFIFFILFLISIRFTLFIIYE